MGGGAILVATATFTFDAERHEYRSEEGRLILSVTQVIKSAGLISFDGINPRVLEHKRQLGTLVHQATQLLDEGQDLNGFDIPEEVMEYVYGYVNFRNDTGFAPRLTEYQSVAEIHKMAYGMKLDREGDVNGLPTILELKCGASHSPAWAVQLCGYAMGLPKPEGFRQYERAAIQLGPDFPRGYKIHPYSDPAEYQVWVAALAVATWKQNANIGTIEDVPERMEVA